MSIFDRLLNREQGEQNEPERVKHAETGNGSKRRRKPKRDAQGRWLPGSSGNPNGRPPKEHCITDALRELGNTEPEGYEGTGWTRNKLLAFMIWARALDEKVPNAHSQDTVLDRTEGKVPQALQHSGPEGGPIEQVIREIVVEHPAQDDEEPVAD